MNEQEYQLALIEAKQEALNWQEKYMAQRDGNAKQSEKIVRQAARIAELEELYKGAQSKENERRVENLANGLSKMNIRIAELEAELDRRIRMPKDLWFQVAELSTRVNELEAAQRWIPVGERLPDNWESVLTIDISKSTRDMVTAFYTPETSLWSTRFSCDLWVTPWMPLPETPIVYGKECEE